MFSSSDSRTYGLLVAGLALVSLATAAVAAPRFIIGGKVMRRGDVVELLLQFSCSVHYVGHQPEGRGDRLRIQLEPTSICSGSAPSIARSREQYLPADAAEAGLTGIEYDGAAIPAALLTVSFRDDVEFTVKTGDVADVLVVEVRRPDASPRRSRTMTGAALVQRPAPGGQAYAINLASSQQPLAADGPVIVDGRVFPVAVSETRLGGDTWYRLRIGSFASAAEAAAALSAVQGEYPAAWIDLAGDSEFADAGTAASEQRIPDRVADTHYASVAAEPGQADALMDEARKAMLAANYAQAVQIYTKVLRLSGHERAPEAQELLALAREKNGQIAHAKAEYERYLAMFANEEGADRVRQRLAAILAAAQQAEPASRPPASARDRAESPWRVYAYFSQYYRRDVNQVSDQDQIISQSALYSDMNVDVRRRGERFDLSSRLSAGYRNDFLDGEEGGSGNQVRVSYAYADLQDTVLGINGRIGRQSRTSGGVLGRFDGADFGYQATERVRIGTVFGRPVNSSGEGPDTSRTFYGINAEFVQVMDAVDLGAFYIRQQIAAMVDRDAVGGELRYFGEGASLWGLVDYDLAFQELGSAWLQGSWRLGSRLSVHGLLDRRHSPWLTSGNALIGQNVASLDDLAALMSEDEIRQLALDRSPAGRTVTLGLAWSLSPRIQVNADASRAAIDASPGTGGVPALEASEYTYYAASVTASSLLKEGDVSIMGLRWSTSDATRVASLSLDTRFPAGRLRINPRLRIDRRDILSDGSTEWQMSPGIRMQWLWNRRLRLEFEAGRQFAERDTALVNADRDSYFVNLGYQAFFQ